ncbi:high-affinity methionine permease [Diplodia corticola]|uniref:High-affinity methionine permease n=1 Tax=Diplodia corticola TaxID=236234 RepID=A0A1J9RUS9_9PEZI|nr:high-affinity methionine permease [Diplodia corticola]OJD31604.1 high-affinity methionine permease [Diplodia corticola]
MSVHHDPDDKHMAARVASPSGDSTALKNSSLEYVAEQGGNGSLPTYQEASGAPVESFSPLGYEVKWYTIIFLNIGQMIGTGVFSTPASILSSTGSVGLSLMYWFIGFIISCCGLGVYLELASYFPARSGAEVVYLEQAYPRPKYFFPVAFAVQTVILSFSSSNAIVLSQYIFKMTDREGSDWELKGIAVAGYTLAVILLIANNRLALWLSDIIGLIKVATLVFISITGLVCLGGHTSVADPTINFHDAFAGTTGNGNGLANALVKITFAYSGYQNAFNVMNEIKNPVKTIKKSAPLSLLIVAILYMLCNVAYFAAVPKEQIMESEQVAASLFFTAIFGATAAKGLNILVVLSAFGNLVSVLIGQSRVIREVGRQGVLPWASFWASTRPFGTPIGPYLLKWGMTILMILAPPAGDAFNFVVDLQNYPDSLFLFLMAAGLYLIRRQRARLGVGRSEFRCWDAAVVFYLLVKVFLLVMPWYPPEGGATGGDVSFWYATYCVAGIGIILACGVYYWVWIYLLPRLGGYEMRQRVVQLPDGAVTHELVRVVKGEELARWDAEHDALGNVKTAEGVVEPVKV